jgi:preprotein translocase subunit SecB|tara:strand:- start:58 stop:477 length:420 start_codon:yes stop_codon:yes gene_type:complete
MTIKHKILLGYIKDLSVETPDPESLIIARENISKYSLNLDLNSKVLKNKMIEVYTKLTHENKISKKKTYFEMTYATVVKIEEEKLNPEEIKKFILCDLQTQIYPQIQKTFLQILKLSGFPDLQLQGNIDFNKLYNERKN